MSGQGLNLDIGFADSNAAGLSSAFVFNGGKGTRNVDTGGIVLGVVLVAAGILGYLIFGKKGK